MTVPAPMPPPTAGAVASEPVVTVELAAPAANAAAALGALAGVEAVAAEGDAGTRFRLDCAKGSDPRAEVFRAAVAEGWTLVELAAERASLEDVFVRLTTRDGDAAPADEVAA